MKRYVNSGVDFDAMDLKQIERTLKIKAISQNPSVQSQIFDDWFQVELFMMQAADINTSEYRFCDVYGYEMIQDNNFIKVYYQIGSLNG